MSSNNGAKITGFRDNKERVIGYIVLILAVCFFSGAFTKSTNVLKVLDYNNIVGEFGKITKDASPGFGGKGGYGIKQGYIHCLSIAPNVWFSVAVMALVDYLGGLKAAQELLSPVLRLVMGVPGYSALAMIASWQSSDTGAAMARDLHDRGAITDNERDILVAYMFSAAATIGMYFSNAVMIFPYLTKPIGLALLVQMVMKFVGANAMRAYVAWDSKRTPAKSASAPAQGGN